MKALVIGGSGFIGLNLVDALLADGHTVRVTRRKHTVTLLLRKRRVEMVYATVDDTESLARAMDGCDVVFFTAGHYPRYSLAPDAALSTGIAGVRAVASAALRVGVERFVYTSSIASLAPATNGAIADEDDVPILMPTDSAYRALKWSMEREFERAQDRGLPLVTILPGGCIGPWDLRVGSGALLVGAVRGQIPFWLDGIVNIVDVGDVALAHVRAASAPTGSRYAVGGWDVRLGWLLRHVVHRYGGWIPEHPLDAETARRRADADERAASELEGRAPFPRELVDVVAAGQPVSSARARRDLGLCFTPLEDALDRAHDWFVRFRYLKPRHTESTHDTP
jgi:dihydroflavonol-4-reductase